MWTSASGEQDFHSVGIDEFDGKHRQIAALIDKLQDAVTQGSSLSEQRLTMHEMEVDVRENCRDEEALMADEGFPSVWSHKEDHLSLYERLRSIETGLIKAERDNALLELDAFRQFDLLHIRKGDQEIANWHRLRSRQPERCMKSDSNPRPA